MVLQKAVIRKFRNHFGTIGIIIMYYITPTLQHPCLSQSFFHITSWRNCPSHRHCLMDSIAPFTKKHCGQEILVSSFCPHYLHTAAARVVSVQRRKVTANLKSLRFKISIDRNLNNLEKRQEKWLKSKNMNTSIQLVTCSQSPCWPCYPNAKISLERKMFIDRQRQDFVMWMASWSSSSIDT